MQKKSEASDLDSCFYGTATVGERGQIVIPAEARKAMAIQSGDKLLIWQHPSGQGLMLVKVDAMREFMNRMLEKLNHAEQSMNEGNEPATE